MFKWLRGSRDDKTKSIAPDANRVVAKSSEAVVNAALLFRLETDSRESTTSSALNTTDSLRDSRA